MLCGAAIMTLWIASLEWREDGNSSKYVVGRPVLGIDISTSVPHDGEQVSPQQAYESGRSEYSFGNKEQESGVENAWVEGTWTPTATNTPTATDTPVPTATKTPTVTKPLNTPQGGLDVPRLPNTPTVTGIVIEQAIREAFPEDPETAVRVAKCESGLGSHPQTYNLAAANAGPMQINRGTWEGYFLRKYGWTWEQVVFDLGKHLQAAREIYDRAGGWSPWSCY